MTRPAWEQLADVEDGNLLIRFIRPETIKRDRPKGQRVETSTCNSGEYEPNEKSYGASVFVEERLAHGIADVLAANPRWAAWDFVRLPVADVRALALHVKYTPMDCEFADVRHAHASLIGMTRPIRARFISLLDERLS